MLDRDLSPVHRAHIINGADDFTGFADHKDMDGVVTIDWWGLAQSFIAMVELADKNNMSLKGIKNILRFPRSGFLGPHTR